MDNKELLNDFIWESLILKDEDFNEFDITETKEGIRIFEPAIDETYHVNLEIKNNKVQTKYNTKYFIPNSTIYKDRGILYRNYAEFLIGKNFETIDEKEFQIGDYKIKINNNPSFLFKVAFVDLCYDDGYKAQLFDNDISTISIQGKDLDKNNLEDKLSEAIFILGYYDKEFYRYYPDLYEYIDEYYVDETLLDKAEGEDSKFIKRRQKNIETLSKRYSEIMYPEAIRLYNAGMKIIDNEFSFLYFYRILEYFWDIARKDVYLSQIQSIKLNDNPEEFYDISKRLFVNNDIDQMTQLLQTLSPTIDHILDENPTVSNPIKSFSQKLVVYRNKIVHAKSENKFEIKTPNLLLSEEETIWIEKAKDISEILIEKYCLNVPEMIGGHTAAGGE